MPENNKASSPRGEPIRPRSDSSEPEFTNQPTEGENGTEPGEVDQCSVVSDASTGADQSHWSPEPPTSRRKTKVLEVSDFVLAAILEFRKYAFRRWVGIVMGLGVFRHLYLPVVTPSGPPIRTIHLVQNRTHAI